jgi:hypothetical protein
MTEAYPLQWPDGWPRTPVHRQVRSRFKVTPDRARRNLLDQIRLLGGRQVVISSNLAIRQDGMPYADQARRRIYDSGVAVYFTLKGKQMSMACDLYQSPHENMHSVGHAIEHLRGLERHGGGHMMERAFAGFTALPASGPDCWTVLRVAPGSSVEAIERAYRNLAKEKHPDAGGTHAAMSELNNARDEALRQVGERV